MKLRPVILNDLPHLNPIEWRFKKHKVEGKIIYRKDTEEYIYYLYYNSFKKEVSSVEEGKVFKTLEEASDASEKWIDLWYSVQGRILSFGAF